MHHVNVKEKVSRPSTGCKSEIWKKVQLNIYLIYTASKNDTSEKSPGIQLENDTLKVNISLKLTSKEIIEGKKSKNPWRARKKSTKICFSRRVGVAPS